MQTAPRDIKMLLVRILLIVVGFGAVVYWFATHEAQVVPDKKYVAGVIVQKLGAVTGSLSCEFDLKDRLKGCRNIEHNLPISSSKDERFLATSHGALLGLNLASDVAILLVPEKVEGRVKWSCYAWPPEAAPLACESMRENKSGAP